MRGSRTESAALSADNSNGLGLNNPGALGTDAEDREDDLVDELYTDDVPSPAGHESLSQVVDRWEQRRR